jgi:hypothetical protein
MRGRKSPCLRYRPAEGEFLLYYIAAHFVKRFFEKLCIKFYPKICALFTARILKNTCKIILTML